MMTVEKNPLPTEHIDALLANYKEPGDLIGQDGILKQLTKALVERAFQAEDRPPWARQELGGGQ